MKLSTHFELSEFTQSQTASRLGIQNIPSNYHINNLKLLCEQVLEPTRLYFNKPVIITSGYRCPALNRAIGGSSSSQHMVGQAADFYIKDIPLKETALWMQKNLNYDQLIYEFNSWVHVSYKVPYRNQELTINRSGTFHGLKF